MTGGSEQDRSEPAAASALGALDPREVRAFEGNPATLPAAALFRNRHLNLILGNSFHLQPANGVEPRAATITDEPEAGPPQPATARVLVASLIPLAS